MSLLFPIPLLVPVHVREHRFSNFIRTWRTHRAFVGFMLQCLGQSRSVALELHEELFEWGRYRADAAAPGASDWIDWDGADRHFGQSVQKVCVDAIDELIEAFFVEESWQEQADSVIALINELVVVDQPLIHLRCNAIWRMVDFACRMPSEEELEAIQGAIIALDKENGGLYFENVMLALADLAR